MSERNLYLAAYDVGDDNRLRAALHCARAYATGGQQSVHEVWLTGVKLPADLRQELDAL